MALKIILEIAAVVIIAYAVYVLLPWFTYLHGRRSRVATVVVGLRATTNIRDAYSLVVDAPFYDEPCRYHVRLGSAGVELSFTPVGTIASLVSGFFDRSYLVQFQCGGRFYPNEQNSPAVFEAARYRGVTVMNGGLVYSPMTLERGALQVGLTGAYDTFWVCDDPERVSRPQLEPLLAECRGLPLADAFGHGLKHIQPFGLLSCQRGLWLLQSCDTRMLQAFANHVIVATARKAYVLAGLEVPDGLESLAGQQSGLFAAPLEPYTAAFEFWIEYGRLHYGEFSGRTGRFGIVVESGAPSPFSKYEKAREDIPPEQPMRLVEMTAMTRRMTRRYARRMTLRGLAYFLPGLAAAVAVGLTIPVLVFLPGVLIVRGMSRLYRGLEGYGQLLFSKEQYFRTP